jgi:mono/diheme cytochrome c family protein
MKKSTMSVLLISAVTMSFVLNGCGVDEAPPPASSSQTVSGVAAAGKAISGTVTLKDSSSPSRIKTTVTGADGSFHLSVDGLKPPFILNVQWKDENAVTLRLHSLAKRHGKANINPLSDVIVAGAGADDPTMVFDSNDPAAIQAAAAQLMSALESLRTVLAPMFKLYGYDKDPIEDDFEADHTGLDALFDDVRIYAASGLIIVRNKRTNGLIFSAPITDIASGTFYQNNLPVQPGTLNGAALYANTCAGCHGALATSAKKGATAAEIHAAIAANAGGMGALSSLTALEIQAIATALAVTPPTPIDGAALYSSKCGSCHGALATSSKRGATASAIQSAITANRGGMGSLSALTADQIAAIAAALATTSTPPPAACTYTYDAWGTCQSNGTQTRNVLSSTPAGCTGTPVVSQACTYVPPSPAACTYTYNAWGACQSSNTQTRTVATSSPAGCVGIPLLTQSCNYVPPVTACTSFTYSAWGACRSDNTQTRTQLTASPAGCTGGTPVLTQSCNYVPPVTACTSFTYSAWGACQSDNTQTRTQLTASPAGCTGGTPVLSQACTSVPPTPACGSCHAIPPSTGKHSFHYPSRATCSTCHGTGYSPTAVTAATHMNGVTNIAATPGWNATSRTCSNSCHGSKSW